MNELVSIIIPAYNSSSTINKCVDSILNQDYKNVEIIIVNDGSKDNTLDVLYNYKKKDDKIKIVNIQNSGVSIARNFGLEIAKGKYIMFVDSDDYIKEDMIKNLVEIREKYNAFAICDYYTFHGNKIYRTKKEKWNKNKLLIFQPEKDFSELFVDMNVLRTPWGKIYDADIIKKNNLIFDVDISLGEDLIFNINYLNYIKKIVFFNDKLYYYYIGNPNSLSKKYYSNMFQIQKKIVEKISQYLSQKKCKEVDKVYRKCLRMIMSSVTNELHKKTNIIDRYRKAKQVFAKKEIQQYIIFLYEEKRIGRILFYILRNKMLGIYLIVKNKL